MEQIMAFICAAWTKDLETGNATVDDQHKQLIDALNALFDAYKTGKGVGEVEKTMDFLVEYTIKHFDYEEEIQAKYDYPDYPNHKQIHADFKKAATGMRQELTNEGPTEAFISRVYTTVARWVVDHIKGEDIKMAEYIKAKM
jgi:hemerythrin